MFIEVTVNTEFLSVESTVTINLFIEGTVNEECLFIEGTVNNDSIYRRNCKQ